MIADAQTTHDRHRSLARLEHLEPHGRRGAGNHRTRQLLQKGTAGLRLIGVGDAHCGKARLALMQEDVDRRRDGVGIGRFRQRQHSDLARQLVLLLAQLAERFAAAPAVGEGVIAGAKVGAEGVAGRRPVVEQRQGIADPQPFQRLIEQREQIDARFEPADPVEQIENVLGGQPLRGRRIDQRHRAVQMFRAEEDAMGLPPLPVQTQRQQHRRPAGIGHNDDQRFIALARAELVHPGVNPGIALIGRKRRFGLERPPNRLGGIERPIGRHRKRAAWRCRTVVRCVSVQGERGAGLHACCFHHLRDGAVTESLGRER